MLLIEDHRCDPKILQELLMSAHDWDIQLTRVTRLRDGITSIRKADAFDVILLDLALADGHGIEILQRVRAEAPDPAIIVLLNHENRGYEAMVMREGAQDYLNRDELDAKLILRSLRYAVERSRMDRTVRTQNRTLAVLEDRHRLARDLHDSISQTLFTSRSISEAALRQWDRNPARARELLEESNRLTASALSEMRVLLTELRPNTLTKSSMRQLFQQYIDMFQTRRDMKIDLEIADGTPLPSDVQIAFYRIMQEALTNIMQHAGATQIKITVQDGGGYIIMMIQDNGAGFDMAGVDPSKLGLGIMRERADNIHAELDIQSSRNHGTHILLRWQKPDAV
ncbi:MAG: histidine kinase [Anaerolineae bacterium]